MCEQLFLFGIKPKEKEPQEEKEKKGFELLYALMSELYKLTIKKPLRDVKYYIDEDIQYAELKGTQEQPLSLRITTYQKLIELIKNNKQFETVTRADLYINRNWE